MLFDGQRAHAFNRGSDARLAGLPVTANPYPDRWDADHEAWVEGWEHCHRYYGVDARRPIRRLPVCTALEKGGINGD